MLLQAMYQSNLGHAKTRHVHLASLRNVRWERVKSSGVRREVAIPEICTWRSNAPATSE